MDEFNVLANQLTGTSVLPDAVQRDMLMGKMLERLRSQFNMTVQNATALTKDQMVEQAISIDEAVSRQTMFLNKFKRRTKDSKESKGKKSQKTSKGVACSNMMCNFYHKKGHIEADCWMKDSKKRPGRDFSKCHQGGQDNNHYQNTKPKKETGYARECTCNVEEQQQSRSYTGSRSKSDSKNRRGRSEEAERGQAVQEEYIKTAQPKIYDAPMKDQFVRETRNTAGVSAAKPPALVEMKNQERACKTKKAETAVDSEELNCSWVQYDLAKLSVEQSPKTLKE